MEWGLRCENKTPSDMAFCFPKSSRQSYLPYKVMDVNANPVPVNCDATNRFRRRREPDLLLQMFLAQLFDIVELYGPQTVASNDVNRPRSKMASRSLPNPR
jgi:hypothetical protein